MIVLDVFEHLVGQDAVERRILERQAVRLLDLTQAVTGAQLVAEVAPVRVIEAELAQGRDDASVAAAEVEDPRCGCRGRPAAVSSRW